ncbi:hypothetical protein FZEAL_1910 [Fusarium zealandicum]|uniref:Allergen n=1 Tax=Fusarium zealandicum TaxID=1053134 RepID=A0A8H4XP34_9HYPO|nr:hypothetical protein FZEAL_1910 [Fusarium zealandicum]
MASELPPGALSKLATSVKNAVTGQSDNVDEMDVEVQAVKGVDKTVETHDDNATLHKEKTAAVVHEDVKSHEHERVDTVVDHEVHQDHHHTTIQPVKDKKVLATEHVYQENEVEEEIDHRDNTAKEKAKKEAAKIHNEKKVEDTTHTKEYAPTDEHEHVHHHIYETIQPVIERETVKQKVIHTTNHIHETEHLNDKHHKATVAPAITMDEFEKDTEANTEASVTKAVSDKTKPQTRSKNVDIEIPMSDVKNGRSQAAVHSKKREVAVEDVEMEDTKAGNEYPVAPWLTADVTATVDAGSRR